MQRMEHVEASISDPELLKRFRKQMERETERLVRDVQQAVSEPICAVAFLYVYEDAAAYSYAYAWTASARAQLGDALDRRPDPVWQPADWDVELDGEMSREHWQEAQQLARQLRSHDADALDEEVDDEEAAMGHAKPFLLDLCAHLNAMDWSGVAQTTDDFVVWPNEHELSELTPADFKAIGPAHVVEVYERRGWLAWLDENAWTED